MEKRVKSILECRSCFFQGEILRPEQRAAVSLQCTPYLPHFLFHFFIGKRAVGRAKDQVERHTFFTLTNFLSCKYIKEFKLRK